MNNKYIKRTIFSIVSLLLVTCILAFTTFEGFGNGFSVFGKTFMAGNEIQDNTCNLKFYWSKNPADNSWKDTENSICNVAFDTDVIWEPGRCEIRYFKVDNTDTCNFGYDFRILCEDENLPQIADVISVYYLDEVSASVNSLEEFTYSGSLSDCFSSTIYHCDELESSDSKICALAFVMSSEADNIFQGSSNHVSFSILVNPLRIEEPEPPVSAEFGIALPDRDILYRVGTYNTVPFTTLFYARDTGGENSNFDTSKITFTYPTQTDSTNLICGNAYAQFTRNSTFTNSTFKFSGSGVIKVDMLYDGEVKASLNLEVMNGANNVTSSTSSPNATSRDSVLLTDVRASGASVSGGYTLYGNGFSINDSRTNTSGTQGFVNMSNGSLDNVRLIGLDYPELVAAGTTNQYYAPGLSITGGKNYIYNSYITGSRYSTFVTGSTKSLYAENTVFSGGTYANLAISVGEVTLKNCITTNSSTSSLRSLSIYIMNTVAKLKLEGSFIQYNWILKSELPDITGLNTVVGSLFDSGSSYVKSYNGGKYVNVGIALSDGESSFTEAVSRACITDKTTNSYVYDTQSKLGVTATLYNLYAADATNEMLDKSINPVGEYDFDQYPTIPSTQFDFTNINYIPKTADSNKYCYYDSNSEIVYISFESTEQYFSWNPMILSVNKYGSDIPYTVKLNGSTVTGNINFSQSGDYTVEYVYTDNNCYYSRNALKKSKQYSKTVNISVTVADPAVVTYPPQFTFGSGGTYNQDSKQAIINNKTYVMPNVSATSSSIGSTTVSGQTVYYPIINVTATGSNGNSSYSSGKIYYFAPAFTSVRIIDYKQDSGATQYTYGKSATKWPHNKSATNGPDTDILTYVSGMPYESSGGANYRKFNSNNNGLCYTTNEFERDVKGSTNLVSFKYKGNDGNDYYYYIQYVFAEQKYSSCFAAGTDIILADGSSKKVEDISFKDNILSWNFFEGKSEGKDVCLLVYHGEAYYPVLNLRFDDGTLLRTIGKHGVFNYDLNRFVYLSPNDYNQYIGDRFVKLNSKGKARKVELVEAYVTEEYTGAYSLTSAQNSNTVANGILTLPPPEEFYNAIEMGDNLKYNVDAFEKDVLKYGLYDYSQFKDYVTYDQYVAFNGKYLKILVDKGLITYEHLIDLIEQSIPYMNN